MDKLETVLSVHSKRYDTPKKTNRSPKVIKDADFFNLLKTEGLTSEYIKTFKHPIFKYTGQITLHGIFENSDRVRVGGYVNVVINKNGSVGIKYNAIDYKKKKEMGKYLNLYGFGYCRDSKGDAYQKSFSDKASCLAVWEKITLDNFYCSKFIFRNPLSGIYTIVININALLSSEFWDIFTAITGETQAQAEIRLNAKEAKDKAEQEARELKWELQRKENAIRQQQAEQVIQTELIPAISHLQTFTGTFEHGMVLVRPGIDTSSYKGIFIYYQITKNGGYYTAKKVTDGKVITNPDFSSYRVIKFSERDYNKLLRFIKYDTNNNLFKKI